MKNYRQRGEVLVAPAPSPGVTSGQAVLIGGLFGVAVMDAATGVSVAFVTEGVHNLPKASGQAWAVGDKLYWDNTAKNVTNVLTSNTRIGIAAAVQASGDVLGDVALGIMY